MRASLGIGESSGLDTGAGQFGLSDKYKEYGWKSYDRAWGYSNEKS